MERSLHLLDLTVIAVYFCAIIAVGVLTRRKIVSDEDFALAGRRLSTFWIGMSAFASWVGLAGIFGTPENVYRYGLSGTWWFQAWLPGILLMAFFLASRLRQRLYVTVADLFSTRYSPAVTVASSFVTSWYYLAWAAVQVFALNVILSTFTDLNPVTGAIIIYLLIIVYTLLGGLQLVVASDVLQAFVFIAVIMVLAPIFSLEKAGGWNQVFKVTNEIPDYYSLYKGAGGETLFVWFLSLLPAAFIDPGGLQRVFAARDSRAAKNGLIFSAVLYCGLGLSITLLGLVARAYLPDVDPQKVMPVLLSQVMPLGLKGLSIAAFLAVAMSTADTALLVISTTLQRDVYVLLRPNISDRERVVVNKVLILLMGFLALLIALKSQSVVTILLLGFSIYVPGLLLPVLAASYNWRVPQWSILSSIVAGAGGAAAWQLLKEPVVPAILAGLVLSAFPFVAGVLFSREIE